MQHLALLALDDHEVDLLSRVRQRDDVRLGAVYHPDPAALVVRLAGLARVPVVFDIEALAALPIDFVVGGDRAATAVRELIGRASREGRTVPVFVPTADLEIYLRDPGAYLSRAVPEDAAGADTVTAAEIDLPPPVPSPPVDTEGPTAEFPIPDFARMPIPETVAEPAPVEDPAPQAPTEPVQSLEPEASPIGSPAISDLYDPAHLSRWIVEAVLRAGRGSAAVLWRREADGQRFTLLSFAPGADALPTIPFPPMDLEAHVRAQQVRVVDPPRTAGTDGPPSGLRLLVAPLVGDRGPFGLLGIFKPASNGDFSGAFVTELTGRVRDLGLALERSVEFAGMNQELRTLRFKERVRDLMLDPRAQSSERWSRLLDFLIQETQADFGQFLRVSEDGSRLSLEASSGHAGEFEGWVSIPVGRGMIGRAFDRDRVIVYASDDGHDDRGVFLLPVRTGRDHDARPHGVLVLDGASSMNSAGEDTAVMLQTVSDIVAPLLKSPPGGGRA